ASIVLPTPGTSSAKMWPWQRSVQSASSMAFSLPTNTLLMLVISASATLFTRLTSGIELSMDRSNWMPPRESAGDVASITHAGIAHARGKRSAFRIVRHLHHDGAPARFCHPEQGRSDAGIHPGGHDKDRRRGRHSSCRLLQHRDNA